MTLNKFQHRVEVFKKASGGTCDKDTVILALEAQDMNSVRICKHTCLDWNISVESIKIFSYFSLVIKRVTQDHPMLRESSVWQLMMS